MEMVWKLGKLLCRMFFLFVFVVFFVAILGVDPAQNLTKYKRWLHVLIQLTNSKIVIM